MGKVYNTNSSPVTTNLEVQTGQPLDNRLVVTYRSDLIDPNTWRTASGVVATYSGMVVVVAKNNANTDYLTGAPEGGRGMYLLGKSNAYKFFADIPENFSTSDNSPLYDAEGWTRIGIPKDIRFDEYTIQLNNSNERYVAIVDGDIY